MPRISAPTVAEHRAAQMRVLLDAARSLLAETGRPPTFSALAERAGLARPSLYQYFRSADDLLLAMVEDVFPGGPLRSRGPWMLLLTTAAASSPTSERTSSSSPRASTPSRRPSRPSARRTP
ncbi:helix-turn-helix domain-containing protein [Oerskovia sp. M15]